MEPKSTAIQEILFTSGVITVIIGVIVFFIKLFGNGFEGFLDTLIVTLAYAGSAFGFFMANYVLNTLQEIHYYNEKMYKLLEKQSDKNN